MSQGTRPTKNRLQTHQYFKVKLLRSTPGFFNLEVSRLHKKAENIADGLAPRNQYILCAHVRGIGERDAQCVCMALENPRPRLPKGFEDEYWHEKLKELS